MSWVLTYIICPKVVSTRNSVIRTLRTLWHLSKVDQVFFSWRLWPIVTYSIQNWVTYECRMQ